MGGGNYAPYQLIEPTDLEILQALVLMQLSPGRMVPASPGSFERFFKDIAKTTYAFSRMQPPRYPDELWAEVGDGLTG